MDKLLESFASWPMAVHIGLAAAGLIVAGIVVCELFNLVGRLWEAPWHGLVRMFRGYPPAAIEPVPAPEPKDVQILREFNAGVKLLTQYADHETTEVLLNAYASACRDKLGINIPEQPK